MSALVASVSQGGVVCNKAKLVIEAELVHKVAKVLYFRRHSNSLKKIMYFLWVNPVKLKGDSPLFGIG